MVISGLRGGSGKTILSLGLIASWRKEGLKVTPFKKGPDYIDAGWLAEAAGESCFNLDLFMMEPADIIQSFISHTSNSGIALIEGNRGLYDGVDHEGTYSTAELAKLLKAPVIIVVNCAKVTSTVAAMVLGCQRLDPGTPIRGVVLNNVGYARQEAVIRKAIEGRCGLPVLGTVPRLEKELFPERHMGLTPSQEHHAVEESLSTIAELGARYLDIKGIWEIARSAEPLHVEDTPVSSRGPSLTDHTLQLRIGVIRDSAFQFYYPENIEELEKEGVEIIKISALEDSVLPEIDALYIGGGFPETHAQALAENSGFRRSLLEAIERGLPVYAECGGLMYLGQSLILNSRRYPMVGAFPLTFGVERKPQAHGYTILEVEQENPFFEKGGILKGHEFHYSSVLEADGELSLVFRVKRGRGIKDGMDGLCYKNTLASYTHLHALGTKEWVKGLIRCATAFRNQMAGIRSSYIQ